MNNKKKLQCRLDRAMLELEAIRVEAENIGLCEPGKANWYLGPDMLYLMNGESHEGYFAVQRPDRVVISSSMRRSGGGDW